MPCLNDCGPFGQCLLLRRHGYLYAGCSCKAGESDVQSKSPFPSFPCSPCSPWSPHPHPTPGVWALRHLHGRCCFLTLALLASCLPLTAHTHPAPTTVALARVCPCLCPAAHTFLVTTCWSTLFMAVPAYSHLLPSVPACHIRPDMSTISLYLSLPTHTYSYLPLPTYTCPYILLQAHARSQLGKLAHTCQYLHIPVHTCFPLPMTAGASYASPYFFTHAQTCCECTRLSHVCMCLPHSTQLAHSCPHLPMPAHCLCQSPWVPISSYHTCGFHLACVYTYSVWVRIRPESSEAACLLPALM